VCGLRHSCSTLSRKVSTAYITCHGCRVYGSAPVRIHASCQRLTAPCMRVWSTAQLRCAFTRGVTAPCKGVGSTAHLRFAFMRGVNGLHHLAWQLRCAWVVGLRLSCDARSREVSTAYCTLHGCLVYGTAAMRIHARCHCTCHGCKVYGTPALRFHARCQQPTSPCMGVWSMAQLRCAFTRGVYGLQHLEWVSGLRHSCNAHSREVSTAHSTFHGCKGLLHSCGASSRELSMAYSTLHACMVYGTATVRLHAMSTAYCTLLGCLVYGIYTKV